MVLLLFQAIETYPTCEPVRLKVFVEELDEDNQSRELSEIDMAVIIDDVVNSSPRFLQDRYKVFFCKPLPVLVLHAATHLQICGQHQGKLCGRNNSDLRRWP